METILIIDDDVAIGNLEQEVLEREGYLGAACLFRNGSTTAFKRKETGSDIVRSNVTRNVR